VRKKPKTFKKYGPIIGTLLLLATQPTWAAQTTQKSSPFLLGSLGLNTIPNARVDAPGTVRIGTSIQDPYVNYFIGFQPIKPLYISIRQTAETSNILERPERLFPGLDAKLRLLKETGFRPEIAVGLQFRRWA